MSETKNNNGYCHQADEGMDQASQDISLHGILIFQEFLVKIGKPHAGGLYLTRKRLCDDIRMLRRLFNLNHPPALPDVNRLVPDIRSSWETQLPEQPGRT